MYDYVINKPPLEEDFLEHHGVKGMRWGIRKAEKGAGERTKKVIKTYNDLDVKRRFSKSRAEKRLLKTKMKETYSGLKKAKRIDYGEKLVKNNKKRKKVASGFAAAGAGAFLGEMAIREGVKEILNGEKTYGGIYVALGALNLTAAAVNLVQSIQQRKKNLSIDAFREETRKRGNK